MKQNDIKSLYDIMMKQYDIHMVYTSKHNIDTA